LPAEELRPITGQKTTTFRRRWYARVAIASGRSARISWWRRIVSIDAWNRFSGFVRVTVIRVASAGIVVSGIVVSGIVVSGIVVSGIVVSGIVVSGIVVSGIGVSGIGISGIAVSGIAVARIISRPVHVAVFVMAIFVVTFFVVIRRIRNGVRVEHRTNNWVVTVKRSHRPQTNKHQKECECDN
jgi:hypothetical protein